MSRRTIALVALYAAMATIAESAVAFPAVRPRRRAGPRPPGAGQAAKTVTVGGEASTPGGKHPGPARRPARAGRRRSSPTPNTDPHDYEGPRPALTGPERSRPRSCFVENGNRIRPVGGGKALQAGARTPAGSSSTSGAGHQDPRGRQTRTAGIRPTDVAKVPRRRSPADPQEGPIRADAGVLPGPLPHLPDPLRWRRTTGSSTTSRPG